jgi:hypothetical protein
MAEVNALVGQWLQVIDMEKFVIKFLSIVTHEIGI